MLNKGKEWPDENENAEKNVKIKLETDMIRASYERRISNRPLIRSLS